MSEALFLWCCSREIFSTELSGISSDIKGVCGCFAACLGNIYLEKNVIVLTRICVFQRVSGRANERVSVLLCHNQYIRKIRFFHKPKSASNFRRKCRICGLPSRSFKKIHYNRRQHQHTRSTGQLPRSLVGHVASV